MEISLAVTNKELSDEIGHEGFWCIFKNSTLNIGDYLFFYKTKTGVNQIYKIIGKPMRFGEFQCEYRKMLTVKTELVNHLKNPISTDIFKSNEILKGSGACRRNFQALLFTLTEKESEELLKLIKENNPDQVLPF